MTRGLRITVFSLIAAAAALLASPTAEALLAKHNCTFCHSIHTAPTPAGSTDVVVENSPTNIEVLCLGCHYWSVDGSQAPYNSDTDGIPADPVQPHRSAADYPGFYITCVDCHNIHDNMLNRLGPHTDASAYYTEGTNAKMVGHEDSDGETPYAMINTLEADFDQDFRPDRDFFGTNPPACDTTLLNACYVRGKRHVVHENYDPDNNGNNSLHGFADFDEDGEDDETAIGLAANVSNWGVDATQCAVVNPTGSTYNLVCLAPGSGGNMPRLSVGDPVFINGFANPANNGVFTVDRENTNNVDYTVIRRDGGPVGAAESADPVYVAEKPMSPYDGICEMCHSRTANHNIPEGRGQTHNSGRTCTACHTHQYCFDRETNPNRGACQWAPNSTPDPNDPNPPPPSLARDLQVDGVSAAPTTVTSGNPVTITVDVTNLGNRYERVFVRYFSDIDGFLGLSTIELNEDPDITNPAVNFSAQTSFEWVAGTVGTHTITARIDPLVFETVINNNSADTLTPVTVQ